MRRSRHSLHAALLATTVVVTVALGWFGWRLLDQQRAIDEDRARKQLEAAADTVAAGIREKLADAGERLSGWLSNPSPAPPSIDGVVVVAGGPSAVLVAPQGALPFVPVSIGVSDEAPPRVFADIEALEFVSHQLAQAADRYRVLTHDRDAHVRAGALLRLGRVLRNSGDFGGALSAYRELAALGNIRTDGLPAELAGLGGEHAALVAAGDREGAQRTASQIVGALDSGKWAITRGNASFYRDELTTADKPASWQLAEALADAWQDVDASQSSRGVRVFGTGAHSVIVLWRSNGSHRALIAAFPDRLFTWPRADSNTWQLTDSENHVLAGQATTMPAQSVTRVVGNAESPWTLHLGPSPEATAATASSRGTLVAMMLAMLVSLWGATYFMSRAIRREARVARLQSDFVAAVSHEFRTPLTTIRQMAEMLEMGRLPTEERKQQYYRVLAGEAARLQGLVETLLNFGRMEAGAEQYQFTDVDAAGVVNAVVREIEPHAHQAGKQIETTGPGDVHVQADEAALRVALRNLIDNAIKYSPSPSTVSIEWRRDRDRTAISVIDHGPGIPRAEQQTIFGKFVRGQSAINGHVKGTGVGLSMVREIVLAHGGEIRLDSQPGQGSTFTLLLPTAP